MNILFISFDADPPNMGGTSTVVNVLAKYFKEKGHLVALAYIVESETPSTFFDIKIKFDRSNMENLVEFFNKFNFDIIYDTQFMTTDYNLLKLLPIGKCKIVSSYHNRPMLRYFPLESLFNIIRSSKSLYEKIYHTLKIPILPFWKFKSQRREKKKFRQVYEICDKIHLLSDRFFPVFQKIVPDSVKEKIISVGNPLVFSHLYDVKNIHQKEKKILVVCSNNYQKRANLLIKIWSEIEKDPTLESWSFDFIGGGEAFHLLKEYSNSLGTKRLKFVGVCNPEEYYRKSSIFLMTSRYEGWPMVLMEAMQMGVVPIVFKSFESLVDIVDDNKTGILVENGNMDEFIKKLKEIMINDDLRNELATNALEKAKKYTVDIIGDEYLRIFENLKG